MMCVCIYACIVGNGKSSIKVHKAALRMTSNNNARLQNKAAHAFSE